MGLPTTRDFNLNPGDPVPSALLDALQDMIIGSKHPEREVPIGPSDMLGELGVPTFSTSSWTSAGAFIVWAPLKLPVGTRVTHVKFTYNRHNAGHMVVSLIELDIATGSAPTTIATFDDNASGNVVTTHDIAAINKTTLTGKAYALKFAADAACGAAGGAVFAAQIFIDRL